MTPTDSNKSPRAPVRSPKHCVTCKQHVTGTFANQQTRLQSIPWEFATLLVVLFTLYITYGILRNSLSESNYGGDVSLHKWSREKLANKDYDQTVDSSPGVSG